MPIEDLKVHVLVHRQLHVQCIYIFTVAVKNIRSVCVAQ